VPYRLATPQWNILQFYLLKRHCQVILSVFIQFITQIAPTIEALPQSRKASMLLI